MLVIPGYQLLRVPQVARIEPLSMYQVICSNFFLSFIATKAKVRSVLERGLSIETKPDSDGICYWLVKRVLLDTSEKQGDVIEVGSGQRFLAPRRTLPLAKEKLTWWRSRICWQP